MDMSSVPNISEAESTIELWATLTTVTRCKIPRPESIFPLYRKPEINKYIEDV
jgi:hypothetical protein